MVLLLFKIPRNSKFFIREWQGTVKERIVLAHPQFLSEKRYPTITWKKERLTPTTTITGHEQAATGKLFIAFKKSLSYNEPAAAIY